MLLCRSRPSFQTETHNTDLVNIIIAFLFHNYAFVPSGYTVQVTQKLQKNKVSNNIFYFIFLKLYDKLDKVPGIIAIVVWYVMHESHMPLFLKSK